jgi:hypothetical protein
MRKLLCFAAVVCLTAVAGASAATPVPRILTCAGKPLLRPSSLVVLSCADANSELRTTHWLSWGRRSATGTTTFGLNLCEPNCASSRLEYFPNSRVRLSEPVNTKSGRLFTRATITYDVHGLTKTFVAYLRTRPL